MKAPSYGAMYKAVEWLDCYEPAPGEDGADIASVRVWLIELANKANEQQFRAQVRKEAIEKFAKEQGVKPRDVRAALKRIKQQNK